MTTFWTTLYQMGIFASILAVGFACAKAGVIRDKYMPDFAKLITRLFLPVMLFECTVSATTREMLFSNWPVVVLAALFYIVVIVVLFGLARILRLRGGHDRVFVLSFAFGNTGFVGIPLLATLYPDYGMLFMALFALVDQPLFWVYGVRLARGQDAPKAFSPKDLVTPNTVALLLAFIAVLLDIPLPNLASDVLKTLSGGTGGLCMVYLGALLFYSDWLGALRLKELYAGIAMKMIALPVAAGHVMALAGLPFQMATCMVVVMSLPVMTVVPMVVKEGGGDGDYAAGIAVATLAVSVVTIPLVQLLAFL